MSIFAYDPQGTWPEKEEFESLSYAHMTGHPTGTVPSCPDCQNEKLAREAERDMRNHPNARQELLDRAARRGYKAEAERFLREREETE